MDNEFESFDWPSHHGISAIITAKREVAYSHHHSNIFDILWSFFDKIIIPPLFNGYEITFPNFKGRGGQDIRHY